MAKIPTVWEKAADSAVRLDWEGCRDRRLLRASVQYLHEQIEQHVFAHWGILASSERIPFSARQAADSLIELLLEIEAIDYFGIACLIQAGTEEDIRKRRRQYHRKELKRRTLPSLAPKKSRRK